MQIERSADGRKQQGDSRKPRSLRRVLFWTLAGTHLGFTLVLSVVAGYFAWGLTDGWRYAARPLAYEVVASLQVEGAGFGLKPTATLAEWQQQYSGVWYVATDGTQTIAHGPAPADAAQFARARDALKDGYELIWKASGNSIAPRGAAVEVAAVGAHPVLVIAGGLPPSILGGGRQGLLLSGLVQFILGAFVLVVPTIVALWWALRRETRRIERVGEAAAAITTRDLAARIDPAPLPSEVRPLADGMNRALAALEDGFTRERLFASMAAHELRTPLAVLTAHLDALPDDAAKAILLGDARRMRALVDDLMTFSHMAGRRNEEATVDLALVAREAVAEMAHTASEAHVDLAFEAEGNASVRGSAAALRLAIRNLIRNAIQHSPARTTVTVRLTPGPRLIVEDAGPGVADADKPQVFQPFWRGLDSKATGSGLGLAIVREVVATHGGIALVEDAWPQGARFVLALGEN